MPFWQISEEGRTEGGRNTKAIRVPVWSLKVRSYNAKMEQVLLRYKREQVIKAHCIIKFFCTSITCLVACNIMCPTLIEAS